MVHGLVDEVLDPPDATGQGKFKIESDRSFEGACDR